MGQLPKSSPDADSDSGAGPRILFLVPSDYEALSRKGVAATILERDEDGFFSRVVTVHPLATRDRILDLNPVHRVYEFAGGSGLWGQPIRLRALAGAPIRTLRILRRISKIVREERIDLIRATDPYLTGLIAWWLARHFGLPFCVSVHADYAKGFALAPAVGRRRLLRNLARPVPRAVLSRADLVLPIRQHLADGLIASGVDEERVQVIPHGVNLELFRGAADADPRQDLGLPPEVKIISFVGRLVHENYIGDVLEIARSLARRRDDFVLVVVGGGSQEAAFAAEVEADPALRERVRCVGFRSREYGIAVRQASHVALCLMGGFSLIEACLAGCPVVSYDVEWHRELVRDGETGFLLGEGDYEGVVARLDLLLDDPERAARMGAAARELALPRHDLRNTTMVKRDVYRSLLSGSGRRIGRRGRTTLNAA